MFFCKSKPQAPQYEPLNIVDIRWNTTEIYDKYGNDTKLLKIEKTLQYRTGYDSPWVDVYNAYNMPIYLDNKKES